MNAQSRTARLVIQSNPESFVYDQVCIVSRDSQMITVNLAALQFVSPATEATKHIDDDIIRVHKGKTGFCVLTGKNRVAGIIATGTETTTKARLVSNSALSRTIVPPQKLSKEDLLAKLANPKGIFYKEPVAPVVKVNRENVNAFSRHLDAIAKNDEAKAKAKEKIDKDFHRLTTISQQASTKGALDDLLENTIQTEDGTINNCFGKSVAIMAAA